MIHLIAALTLFAISGIHIYWALGGYWGISVAVPQQEGQPLFKPGMAVTIMVAMVLAYAGIVSLALAGISTPSLSPYVVQYSAKVWGTVFLMRGLGGWLVLGLLGKLKGTPFAKMDTKFYSPLCLFLAATFWMAIL